jgi:two-component system, OmpR family, alkaline phosphatase synthesis response regulator PhoP
MVIEQGNVVTKKILIIDDDAHVVRLLTLRLKALGYHVSSLDDGVEVLAIIGKEKPDLIILDVVLPSANGYDICAML